MEGNSCPDDVLLNDQILSFLPKLSGCASTSLHLSAVDFGDTKAVYTFCPIYILSGLLDLWPSVEDLHHTGVTNIGIG